MTPEERGIANAKEKEKAINAVTVLALGMALWTGSVLLNGGYTDQPEHHDMWRGINTICGFWGVILLLARLFIRASTLYTIAAIVITICGFYLASAPTL